MPELPEVETIATQLNKVARGLKIENIWTDAPKIIKRPSLSQFVKNIKGKIIEEIYRKGKNIIFKLSDDYFLVIHQKLTGHLLYGKWKEISKGKFLADIEGPLKDDIKNQFLHFIIFLNNNFQIALSDLRKFAKVLLLKKEEFENLKELKSLGPDPLDKYFTFKDFKNILFKKRNGKIKQILMDQNIISGIGNIYSDEILWWAKINPQRKVASLKEGELKEIFIAMKEILEKAIKLKGESISDFRDIFGNKGNFDKMRKVYQKEGERCERCGGKIIRIKIGGRSSYYCPKCQQ